jgi:hypothetical protein
MQFGCKSPLEQFLVKDNCSQEQRERFIGPQRWLWICRYDGVREIFESWGVRARSRCRHTKLPLDLVGWTLGRRGKVGSVNCFADQAGCSGSKAYPWGLGLCGGIDVLMCQSLLVSFFVLRQLTAGPEFRKYTGRYFLDGESSRFSIPSLRLT